MPGPVEEFVRALRSSGVRVSVAEAMEAHEIVATFGYGERPLLKDALGLTLAKTVEEKQTFSETFDLYFSRRALMGEDDPDAPSPLNADAEQTGNPLADMLLSGDRDGLVAAMAAAARQTGVETIMYPTQINLFSRRLLDQLGLRQLEQMMVTGASPGGAPAGMGTGMATTLEGGRRQLLDQARAFVTQQYQLYGRANAVELRQQALERTPLAAVEQRDFDRMNAIIRRMAKKLASRYAHRHKRTRRGHLDVRRTMRVNMAHDGIPFDVVWKQKKIDRPKVVAICDVSRSVAAAARFLLMLLYNLNEALSDVRSFAFSSHLVGIDDELAGHPIEDAIPLVLDKIGFMPTDYGRALEDLKADHAAAIDRRTTVIILGDARTNRTEPRADIMKWVNQRAKRVVWLNPEPQTFWGIGDSEMPRYRPYCHVAKTCKTIKQLERVVDDILRSTGRA